MAAVVIAGGLSVLYLVPFSEDAVETDFFAVVVPYNVSEVECTSVWLDHTGTYSFDVQLPGQAEGDVFLLTVTGPNAGQLYHGASDTSWDGSFRVNDLNAQYQFCMETPGFTYPIAPGGAAAGTGTLDYTHAHPIL